MLAVRLRRRRLDKDHILLDSRFDKSRGRGLGFRRVYRLRLCRR